jgi:hypothetical protein
MLISPRVGRNLVLLANAFVIPEFPEIEETAGAFRRKGIVGRAPESNRSRAEKQPPLT